MGRIIGIDLGTTNSCVAVMESGTPKVIVNEEGNRTTPSVVAFTEKETLVGLTARRQAVVNSENTVYSVKRFIGSNFNEIKKEAKKVSFNVIRSKGGQAKINVNGRDISVPEISAKVLQKLKYAAEKYLGSEVTEAVITVPAYFNDSQRQATKDAGKIAGLEVKRIINEPTAAALAYGLEKNKDELIAVYDFGGGTFDVSILEISGDLVEVLSTAGDTHLGGDNVDEKIIDFLLETFKNETGVDVSTDPMAMQRLRESAEKAKIELSSTLETSINLPFLTADISGPKHLNTSLSRAKLESLISSIIVKTFKSCDRALKDAGKSKSEIDQVILVGGSTRIPKVINEVKDHFGKDPCCSVNPDEVVAMGAAIQAGVLAGDVKDILLLDVTPLSLGIETLGNVFTKLIERNATIPAKKSEIFSTAQDNQPQVEIHVLQGERSMCADNRTLGSFSLDGIPAAPRGVPQIEVCFDIDANGILNVSAKDKVTGKERNITIKSSDGLSDIEINQMVTEASENEESDKQQREHVEVKNQLSSLAFQSEGLLKEHGEKLAENEKNELIAAIKSANDLLENEESQTASALQAEFEQLQACLQNCSKSMYENATATAAATEPQPPSGNEDEDIIDADIVA